MPKYPLKRRKKRKKDMNFVYDLSDVSITLLDSRRSNNVAIGVSRFNKRFKDTEILDALITANEELTADDVYALENLFPSVEEVDKLKLFRGDVKALGRAETFMFGFIAEPNVKWISQQLLLARSFDTECDRLLSYYEEVNHVLEKLVTSKPLKVLMGTILELGNMTNYDYGRSNTIKKRAVGFKIDSLTKLREMKSKDGKSSLLNYLAAIADKSNMALVLPSQVMELSGIRQQNSGCITDETRVLLQSCDAFKSPPSNENSRIDDFMSNISEFISHAAEKSVGLKRALEEFNEAWAKTAEYFGESPEDHTLEELVGILEQFFRHFEDAIKQNEHRKQLELKKQHQGSPELSRKQIKSRSSMRLAASAAVTEDETIHGFSKNQLLNHIYFKQQTTSYDNLAHFETSLDVSPTPNRSRTVSSADFQISGPLQSVNIMTLVL